MSTQAARSTAAHPRPTRHRWKVLGIGVAANISFAAALAGIPTTAVFLRADYRFDTAELGVVLGLLGLGVAVSELPWGLLTDRWGDRRVLLTGLGTTAVWLLLMALFAAPSSAGAPDHIVLAGAMLVLGLLGGSVNGSSGRAIMAWFRDSERGLAMSIRQTAVPAGGGLGALVLPPLASSCGFAAVYAVLALYAAATAVFAWYWLHEPPLVEAPQAQMDASAPPLLRDGRVWRIAVAIAALCMPQTGILAFTAIFLHDFVHVGVATTSAALITVQAGASAIRVWSGYWTDRHRNRRVYLRTCAVVAAALFAALGATAALPGAATELVRVLIGLLILAGISVSAWHGVAFTELATLAGVARAGTALGLGNTCAFGMYFVVPLAIPGLLALGDWPVVWLAAGCCALIAYKAFPRPALRVDSGQSA